MHVVIESADLDEPGFVAFKADHLRDLETTAPPESRYALAIDGMRAFGARVCVARLDHALADAANRGVQRVSPETGATDIFVPAVALYRSRGLARCPPFGIYRDDPLSQFLTRALEVPGQRGSSGTC